MRKTKELKIQCAFYVSSSLVAGFWELLRFNDNDISIAVAIDAVHELFVYNEMNVFIKVIQAHEHTFDARWQSMFHRQHKT